MPLRIGIQVYKIGAGYSGPGRIVADFVGWNGVVHYVVEHQIDGGDGCFYHIYLEKQLKVI